MIEKDLGFIIRRTNFRDTSVIATIYTSRFGKISGIFKGFYTGKKEFSSPLDIFSLNEFIFYPRAREIWLVSFADIKNDYPFLKKDYRAASAAGLFCWLVDRVMQPWDVNIKIYQLLKDCFEKLEGNNLERVVSVFLIKFLALSGFQPQLNTCLVCQEDLPQRIAFSPSRGGLICCNCSGRTSDACIIGGQSAMSLRYLQNSSMDTVFRLSINAQTRREIFYLLDQFLVYHLGLELPQRFLGRINWDKPQSAWRMAITQSA